VTESETERKISIQKDRTTERQAVHIKKISLKGNRRREKKKYISRLILGFGFYLLIDIGFDRLKFSTVSIPLIVV
jgi:hypothetical protein